MKIINSLHGMKTHYISSRHKAYLDSSLPHNSFPPCFTPDAATLSFDGTQYVRMFSDQESNTQAEDITFRFRTNRPNGLLLATTSTLSSDRLELALQAGKLRLTVKLGDKDKVRRCNTSFYSLLI